MHAIDFTRIKVLMKKEVRKLINSISLQDSIHDFERFTCGNVLVVSTGADRGSKIVR